MQCIPEKYSSIITTIFCYSHLDHERFLVSFLYMFKFKKMSYYCVEGNLTN